MKRCELLAPAGNMEMLKYAILYGADAVYLAGHKYGARKFAANFSGDELVEAVRFAHLYDVKVYITINTLIYEEEVNDFIEYVKYISAIGVDAVLVQDFGMINVIRKVAPMLEVHASTQMHNNGSDVLELLKKIGVKRAVLDREMTLEEIRKLPRDIEKEAFVHGALCVSYSGQCLFSSLVLGRSGNRGECAGLCRLPYWKKENGVISKDSKYYLSLKDACFVDSIPELIEAGICSLKIEGRMKSPEYVGYITKIYREKLDSYYEGEFRGLTKEEMKNISILFNRGLTRGFLNSVKSKDIVNLESPNHIGIHLGRYEARADKVSLKLDEDLKQGDVIRFKEDDKGMTINFLYDKSGNLINSSKTGSCVFVDNFLDIKGFGELRLVASSELNKELARLPKRTVKIDVRVFIKSNVPIELTIICGEKEVTKFGAVPLRAINRPIGKDDVRKQLSKTGNTVYKVDSMEIDLDEGIFVNLKDLNELRRAALEELDAIRTSPRVFETHDLEELHIETGRIKPHISVVVETKEQYEVAIKYTKDVYTSNRELFDKVEIGIHPKYVSSDDIKTSTYIAGDYGMLDKIKIGDRVMTDYMLNVTNSHTVNSILAYGVENVTMSVEAKLEDIKALKGSVDYSKVGVLMYGDIQLMKMKYNPQELGVSSLVDRNKEEYHIKSDKKYRYLMGKRVDRIEEVTALRELGIGNYRVDFFREGKEECESVLKRLSSYLK